MSRLPDTKIEHLYSLLYEMIVSGKLDQGVQLIEDELAARFSVSRPLVRDVIEQMTVDGLVCWENSSGQSCPVVAPLYEREMEELHEIVASLEALAARRVAALPAAERKILVAEMKRHNKDLANTCTKKPLDIMEAVEIDHALHGVYIIKGGGPRVVALRRTIKPQSQRYHLAYLPAYISRASEGLHEHDTIIAAIAEGSEEKADRAVQTHWLNASARLKQAMALWSPDGAKHSGNA